MTALDIDTLQDAIAADIQAAFPDFQTVEFYAEHRKDMPLPACLLELTEWQDFVDPDAGTEQLSVQARFEARIIIRGVETQESKRAIRRRAAALSLYLYQRRWTDEENEGKKLPTGPAEFLGAFPDEFAPELDQYEVWRVEWQQVLHLGEDFWQTGDDFVPDYVFVGVSPEIGTGHEDDYIEITGGDHLSVVSNDGVMAG